MTTFATEVAAMLDHADATANRFAHQLPAEGVQVSDFELIELIDAGVEADDVMHGILEAILSGGLLAGTNLQERCAAVARKRYALSMTLLSLAERVENWCVLDIGPTVH